MRDAEILRSICFTSNLILRSRGSSVGIGTGYGLDDRVRRFDSRRELGIFLFSTASRLDLGPTQPPIQWVPGVLSPAVKRPGREADHSLSSSAEVKNSWHYAFTPKYAFVAWCLVKHRDNFTLFTFLTWFSRNEKHVWCKRYGTSLLYI
jgi:hypothetical protein